MSEYCCFCCCCPAPTSPPRLRSDARVCGWKTTTMHYNKYTPPPPPPLHLPLSCPSKTCLQAGLIKGINEVEDMLRYNIAQAKLNERGNYGETANQPTNQPTTPGYQPCYYQSNGAPRDMHYLCFFQPFHPHDIIGGGHSSPYFVWVRPFLIQSDLSVENGRFRLQPKSGFLTQSKKGGLLRLNFFRLSFPTVEKLDFFD